MTGIYKYKNVFGSLPVNGDDPAIDTDFKIGTDENPPTQKEEIQAESKNSLLTIENVVHFGRPSRRTHRGSPPEIRGDAQRLSNDFGLRNAHLGFTTQIHSSYAA
mgnify:CR=1 FL=1